MRTSGSQGGCWRDCGAAGTAAGTAAGAAGTAAVNALPAQYDAVMKLALERGFYFPSCGPYGDAHAGFWEYGPNGVGLKNRFLELWRRELVRRDRMMEIDGSQIMSPSVFKASGHLASFADPVVKCTECGATHRVDRLVAEEAGVEIPESAGLGEFDAAVRDRRVGCPGCGGALGPAKKFNMMFGVGIGPDGEPAYLRPETCQSIFVDFPRLYKTMRGRLPLGVAQVGKSFRNEISPRQSLLRLREFYQAEIEVFCNPSRLDEVEGFGREEEGTALRLQEGGSLGGKADVRTMTAAEAAASGAVPSRLVAYYLALLSRFYEKAGIDMERTRFRRLGDKEKAFYAQAAFDFEVETSTGWLELVACNYRAGHDLSGHAAGSGEKFEVMDGGEKVLPHVFEISMGIDRSLYAILEHGLREDAASERTVLSIRPYLAPVQVGVLSLVKKDGLREKADEVFALLRGDFEAFLDHSGAIGRRYRRLDEIGAPLAVTIDHGTLKDGAVTLRERDSMEQSRIPISGLRAAISERLRAGD